MTTEDKAELFLRFQKDTKLLSVKSPYYRPDSLSAADIIAMTTRNLNDIELYNQYELNNN
jgi:hypothetical protein